MATEYKGLTIKFNADTRDFNKALKEAKAGARGVTTELRLIQKGLQIDPKNTDLLAQKQEAYRRKIEATRKELEAYKQLEREASTQNDGKGLTDQQWTKLKSDIALTTAELKKYEQALFETQAQQMAQNSALGAAGAKLTDVGKKLEGVSAKASAVGGALTRSISMPIALAGSATVVAATKIDTSLTNVKKTVDGTAEDYQMLKDAAIEFSQTNAVSASQLLDIESLGAQLGYTLDIMSNGKSQVQEFGEVVSGLDIATNMDAETAGTELAQFFNIMQLSKEETQNYASAIVDLGNKNATTESAISAMAMRIAGAGKQIGLSAADVLGLSTALTSLGIEAEMGGTAISTIMSNIDKSVALNNDKLQTWAQTAGMTTEQFANAWKEKPVDALNAVLQGMNGAVESGGNMAVMLDELGISSLRQTDVMKRLAGSGDVMSKAVTTANTAWKENTALTAEVENRNNSLAAKFEMLKNKVIAVAEDIGRPLADALLEALEAGEPLFDVIANGAQAFSEMSKEEQQTVMQMVALVASAGPLLKIMGNTSSVCKGLGNALTSMSKTFAKFNLEATKAPKNLKEIKAAMTASANATKANAAATEASAGSLQKATVAQKALTLATKAGAVAMNLFKVALPIAVISLAVTAISKFAEANEKATKKANNLKFIQDNLTSSLNNVTPKIKDSSKALYEQQSGAENAKKSLAELRDEIDENIQKQADFAQSQKDTWGEINGINEYVSEVVKRITELCDKESLTTDEQAELNAKVAEYNTITGDTLKVIDAKTGKLNESTEKLNSDTEAWKRNAEAQALQERYVEIVKNRLDAEDKAKSALDAYSKAQDDYNKATEKAKDGTLASSNALKDKKKRLEEAEKAYQDSSKTLNEYWDAQRQTADRLAEVNQGINNSKQGLIDLMNTQTLSTDSSVTWADKLSTLKVPVDDFALALETAGVKTSDLSKLTDEKIAELGIAYNNGTEAWIAKLEEFGLRAPAVVGDAMDGAEYEVQNSTVDSDVKDKSDNCYENLGFDGYTPSKTAMEAFEKRIQGSSAPGDAGALANATVTALDKKTESTTAGENFSDGFSGGIKSRVPTIQEVASGLANAALIALKITLGIASPSKVTTEYGGYFSEGFQIGIKNEEKSAVNQAKQLGINTQKALKSTIKTQNLLSTQDMKANITMTANYNQSRQQQRLEKLIMANRDDNSALVEVMDSTNAKIDSLVNCLQGGQIGVYYNGKLVGAMTDDMSRSMGRLEARQSR